MYIQVWVLWVIEYHIAYTKHHKAFLICSNMEMIHPSFVTCLISANHL